MALTNYVRTRSRKNGGIRMLGLIERSEIAEVTAQGSTTEFTAITFEEGFRSMNSGRMRPYIKNPFRFRMALGLLLMSSLSCWIRWEANVLQPYRR